MQQYIDFANEHMEKTINYLKSELSKVKTGRAQTSMLDNVLIEAYGNNTPLNQVSLLTTPDAHQILVKPFDPNLLEPIEKGILKSNLGFNPINDGENIRINIPPLTEETRKEVAKNVKAIGEETKVKIRNVRRDSLDKAKKDELTKDELKGLENKIQEVTNKYNKLIDQIVKEKEDEVMKI